MTLTYCISCYNTIRVLQHTKEESNLIPKALISLMCSENSKQKPVLLEEKQHRLKQVKGLFNPSQDSTLNSSDFYPRYRVSVSTPIFPPLKFPTVTTTNRVATVGERFM